MTTKIELAFVEFREQTSGPSVGTQMGQPVAQLNHTKYVLHYLPEMGVVRGSMRNPVLREGQILQKVLYPVANCRALCPMPQSAEVEVEEERPEPNSSIGLRNTPDDVLAPYGRRADGSPALPRGRKAQ